MNLNLKIRELQEADIPFICDYWLNADAEYLRGMGVDLVKLPTRDQLTEMLKGQLQKPLAERQGYALIWLVNAHPVGHCNVNPFVYGETATMHLHLWRSDNRHKGIGTELVKASVVHFFRELKIHTLISEPYSLNPAPNKTLAKCGFRLVKTYITTPGSICFEQAVNRWEITKGDL